MHEEVFSSELRLPGFMDDRRGSSILIRLFDLDAWLSLIELSLEHVKAADIYPN